MLQLKYLHASKP